MAMAKNLDGMVAIVTGGAGGIGRATCLLMAERGALVAVADIDSERARNVAEEIRSLGGQANHYGADVVSEEQIEALVAATVRDFGGVDILSSNAAAISRQFIEADSSVSIHEMTVELWDAVMAVNLRGAMLCSKYAIREMLKRGGGSIINTSSTAGQLGRINMAAYGVSKGGLDTLTLYIATAYGKQGIRCNTVSPGPILTEKMRKNQTAEMLNMRLRHVLTPNLGDVGDVAQMIAFLASDDAKFISGQLIGIDGGIKAHLPWYADQNDMEAQV
jgi:NAD(P)-dependent dehydrogenase (short-subunit alcohol dehydrogenase family)